MRRWSITLSRIPDTGRYGLGLNDANEVTLAPDGSPLMKADIIIGCEGERLGLRRLEDYLLHHGEPTIELEVHARRRRPHPHTAAPPSSRESLSSPPLPGPPRALLGGGVALPRLFVI